MKLANVADFQLKSCNRWVLPDGTIKLPVAHTLCFYQQIAANAILPDVELGTPSDHDFLCKVVSSTGVTPGTIVQIQWPDGRYLSNPGVDFFSFVGTGKRGRLIHPHKFLPKASKIRINLDNSLVGTAANMEIFFEGVLLVDMVP